MSKPAEATPRPLPGWAVAAFYWVMTRLMAVVVCTFGRWRVRGREHVPASGPLLIVANHLNNADPPLIGATIRNRRIRFMAKIELFQGGIKGLPIRLFGAFPVRRFEADLAALRTAQELLKAGEAVAILPEGHRNRSGTAMQQPYPGAALIALRSGAPVLPVAITGTQQIHGLGVLLRYPRISVTIGEPFLLERAGKLDRAAVQAGSEQIMRHIAALLPPAYRGVWGEAPSAPVSSGESATISALSDETGASRPVH
ncbi:MAG TPA: lysophospholipid acyltransferase family protein [Dehalococcoidia bacterium]|nr:lysophospholipid acyltransferase family protein [Dehalococcoidia bacterium]